MIALQSARLLDRLGGACQWPSWAFCGTDVYAKLVALSAINQRYKLACIQSPSCNMFDRSSHQRRSHI